MARPRKYFFMDYREFDPRLLVTIGDTIRIREDQTGYPETYTLYIVTKIHPRKGGVTVVKVAP
ncbi:MAG: hypothetical protein V4563_17105 [Pseudomonadota bacterium]